MLYPFVQNLIADVQERLIFRAETFIQDEVEHYQLSRDDFTFFIQESQIQGNISHDDHEWFLHSRVRCRLATLYHCPDSYTFSSLAAEVVQVCMESIVRVIAVTVLVCVIQMLVYLLLKTFSSCVSNLAIWVRSDGASGPGDLDLAQIHGEASDLFGWAGIFAYLRDKIISLSRGWSTNLDSHKRLDQCVKVACEAYIMFVTREIVDPMSHFSCDSLHRTPLTGCAYFNLGFATPERLAEIMLKWMALHKLPQFIRQMTMCIDSTVSRDMILNAIKSNVVEAHSQFSDFVTNMETTLHLK